MEYRQTVLAIQQKMEQQDPAAATELLKAAQMHYPHDGGLANLQGVLALETSQPEQARAAFERAIQWSPRLIAPLLNLARLDIQTASPAEKGWSQPALKLYDQVLAINAANTEANMESSRLLLEEGEPRPALVRLRALRPAAQGTTRAKALFCGADAELGDESQAGRVASALAAAPDLTGADVNAALPGLLAARRADLLDLLLSAVKERTDLSAHDLRLLGLAQEAEGKLAAARSTLEQAYSLDSGSAAVLADLARIAAAEGKDQDALGYLAHARVLAPKDPALAFSFGVICSRMNLQGEAQKAISEALTLRPNDPHYVLSMSKVTMLSENALDASPYLIHYRELRPNDPEGTLLTGIMYFRAKDYDSAKPWLLEAQHSESTAPSAEVYLGSIARQQDQPEKALEFLELASRAQPDDAQTHAELGLTLLRLKRYTDAETELERATKLDAMNYEANFGLVQVYTHENDPRRVAQAQRFEEVKSHREDQSRLAMRVIEAQPEGALAHNP